MKDLIVSKKYDNKKLSKLLMETYPALKFSTFSKALKKKDILMEKLLWKIVILLLTHSKVINI